MKFGSSREGPNSIEVRNGLDEREAHNQHVHIFEVILVRRIVLTLVAEAEVYFFGAEGEI